MKLFNLTIILLLGLFVATGCQDDIYTPETDGAERGEMVLKYTVDGDMPLARSVAAMTHESTIKRVHVLFFDTTQEDLFVAYKAVGVTPGKGTFSIDAPENLELERPYRVLAIGNGDTFAPEGHASMSSFLASFSGTYNDILGSAKVHHSGAFTRSAPGELPMFGHFMDKNGGESTFTVTLEGEQKKVKETDTASFLFSRAVCRFDIHNLVGHVLDIRYARVINNPDGGFLFADGLVGGKIPDMTPSAAPAGDGYMPVTEDMEEGVNTTQRLEGSLYGFPNIVNTTVVNDSHTTALMIAGYYIDPETGTKDSELTYYRFNLANLGESQVLNRNYCYRATVKGVKRRGAADEKEAYNDASPIFVYDVNPTWNTNDDNVTSDKDGNFLIVNQTHLTFQGEANESDFVELHVSTNPELTWEVQWMPETGNANNKFTFEKLSNSAVKCGPTEKNDTKYVRYGYLQIVATNPQSGKVLTMPIYLMQLSTEQNVKTLTVNGNTGTFTQELNPMGGTINLQVVTGSVENMWSVEDDGNMLANWDSQGVSFTTRGGNNNDLVISVPANISGQDRAATLIVSLDNNETNADGSKKVPDVIINLTQKMSPQLMEVINFPSSGTMDIECLDLEDFANPNGVVNPKNFIVRLTDTRYRYMVWTDFDKNRDLVLSKTNHVGKGSAAPATATHPAAADGGPLINKNDTIKNLTNGEQFWINPFRTGPGDPRIDGHVYIKAYLPDDDTAPTEERSFTVRLTSKKCEIGDCLIPYNDGYFLIADRNLGTPSLKTDDAELPATYYDSNKALWITGQGDRALNNVSFKGDVSTFVATLYCNSTGTRVTSAAFSPTEASCTSKWIDSNQYYKDIFESEASTKWGFMRYAQASALIPRVIHSKFRCFIVSAISGKEPQCAWFHGSNIDYPLYDLGSFSGGGYGQVWHYRTLKFNGSKLLLEDKNYNAGYYDAYNYTHRTSGLTRLVRTMTEEDVEAYKTNYLGRAR